MTYCPECGGEVLAESAVYCYRCGTRLEELPPSDDEDGSIISASVRTLIDGEIATITADYQDEISAEFQDAPTPPRLIEESADKLTMHTIGYGKGLIKAIMIDTEAANEEFEYTDDDYLTAYRWVQQTVESRREYIKDALQSDEKDE